MENYSRELSALRPAGWCQVAQARESAHEFALQDPEQRSGVRLQGGAAPRPRRPSGADPSLPFSAPTSGSPLGRCGAWASETLPSLRGARPAWAGTAKSLELERQSSPSPPSACRGSARAAVSRTIDHRKTRLINSKLGLKRREMGKEGGAEYSHFCPGHLSFIPLPSSAVECHIWQAGSSGNLGAAVGWASCPRAGRVASRAL